MARQPTGVVCFLGPAFGDLDQLTLVSGGKKDNNQSRVDKFPMDGRTKDLFQFYLICRTIFYFLFQLKFNFEI